MKDRLLTLLGAALAFYLVFRLMFPETGLTDRQISLPTTEDRGKYGLAGMHKWLEQSGVPVYSLRERYSTLNINAELENSGNILVMSLPHRLDARSDEREQLAEWLRNGNHLLLLVAMSDWPEWALRGNSGSVTEILSTFGLEMSSAQSENEDETDEDPEESKNAAEDDKEKSREIKLPAKPKEHKRKLLATHASALAKGIRSLQATWLDSEGLQWKLTGENTQRSLLVLFKDEEDQQPAIWQGYTGAGTFIITRHADMFGNTSLNKADNAKLLENIINDGLGKNGRVIFDDMHQGLSAIYDPDAFFSDSRLHNTLWFLLALWIIYVMGHTNRFSPVKEKRHLLSLREHIKGVGNLFARRLHSSAIAQRHAQHFFNEVRASCGLPQNSQPVWSVLESNAAISDRQLHTLKKIISNADQHKKISLVRLLNILNLIRRKLR